MRVLLITGAYPPMHCGIGDYTSRLARELALLEGLHVGVLTSVDAGADHSDSVEVLRVARTWGLRDALRILRRIRSWKADVVHIHYPSLVYGSVQWLLPTLAWLSGCRVVQTWHEYYSPHNWPIALCALVPGGLVVVRPEYRERMPGWLRWLTRSREFRFVPNASAIPTVDPSPEESAALRDRLKASSPHLVAYFGFAHPNKGIESLFSVCDPDAHHLVLVCELDDRNAYHSRLLRLANSPPWQGRVTVTGFLPAIEVARILAAADAAVFPFLQGGGEWNTSIHAALAQGTFVLSTAAAGEAFDPERNLALARPGDEDTMRALLSQNLGRRVAPRHGEGGAGWRASASAHLKLYESLLARDGRSHAAGGGER